MADDTIDREKAIDTANVMYERCDTGSLEDYHNLVVECLKVLPPAKPQIIRCKKCVYQNKGQNESESWNLCGYRPWLYIPISDDHFCGYAERRMHETD